MTDFLLELRSEEIPARMQAKARQDLAALFAAELAKSGLTAAETITYATPRRLALIARGLPDATQAVSEEIKGPRTSAPAQALEGFLRKTGLTQDQLVERDGVWFAVVAAPGKPTKAILHDAIQVIVHKLAWPKSMRWGAESLRTTSLRWVRPLQGIVALFGNDIVEGAIALQPGIAGGDAIAFGAATVGHRFHHPGVITIGSAGDYVEKLRACHVIVDQDERQGIIAMGATMASAKAGLTLIRDDGLLAENAGLTEWPVPLLGRFDADFLSLPPEVIQLTARVNQKYFVCQDGEGKLANAFICVANIDARDGGEKIVEGNRKVLAARLSDARFFYDTDVKTPLEDQAGKLDKIVFHEKLGTVADKVNRVATLARWLVERGIVGSGDAGPGAGAVRPAPSTTGVAGGSPPRAGEELAALAERAARLCKADLVTGMVGEFPELQGVIGGYYAAAQGEHPAVAAAIRDHYKPVGQGDEVPTDPVTVAVSLADKLDSLICFFAADLQPTGSKDPFALRRATLAVIALLTANGIRLPLSKALVIPVQALLAVDGDTPTTYLVNLGDTSDERYRWIDDLVVGTSQSGVAFRPAFKAGSEYPTRFQQLLLPSAFVGDLFDFFADRLKVQQREAGVRHDLIDAVFALGGEDDLVRLLARVQALQAFVATADGANLLAGYKRAANILKKEDYAAAAPVALTYTPEPAEAALIDAIDVAAPRAGDAVAAEDFAGAMAALATLRAPIDAFFDQVTVNDADSAKRAARLALLARMRDAVHAVADFSKIEG